MKKKKDMSVSGKNKRKVKESRKRPYIDSEMIKIELARIRKLTGLPLTVTNIFASQHGAFNLPQNQYLLDDESASENYLMSNGLSKEEMHECLFVVRHVLERMLYLGKIQQSHNEEHSMQEGDRI